MTTAGVNRKSTIIIISELDIDVSQWSSACKLATWSGRNKSIRKKESVKISKATIYFKSCLVQVAHVAIMRKNLVEYLNVVAKNVPS